MALTRVPKTHPRRLPQAFESVRWEMSGSGVPKTTLYNEGMRISFLGSSGVASLFIDSLKLVLLSETDATSFHCGCTRFRFVKV